MSKKIIRISGCNDCPFGNDDINNPIRHVLTCNISDDKENLSVLKDDYRPNSCELNKWDAIQIEI